MRVFVLQCVLAPFKLVFRNSGIWAWEISIGGGVCCRRGKGLGRLVSSQIERQDTWIESWIGRWHMDG